jgi:hypothetical protein
MKKLSIVVVFLAISIAMTSVSAQSQTLWGKTAVGMSPSEVIEVVDGA